jgi:hypothetical protein
VSQQYPLLSRDTVFTHGIHQRLDANRAANVIEEQQALKEIIHEVARLK